MCEMEPEFERPEYQREELCDQLPESGDTLKLARTARLALQVQTMRMQKHLLASFFQKHDQMQMRLQG
jgi:hypothetical protein